MNDVIIVGSGVAGHSAARELSRLAPHLSVRIIGAEQGFPYDRPALSKDYLLAPNAKMPTLGAVDIYGENPALADGTTVVKIDRHRKTVITGAGEVLPYRKLLLATGSRLRKLPIVSADNARIHYLRTVGEAQKLRDTLHNCKSVAIVGGGFVGLEVAAAARQLGCEVTVLEQDGRLVSRVGTPAMSSRILNLHRANGVNIVFGASVMQIEADASGVTVYWAGSEIRTDMIVVGIGVLPNSELADEAGVVTDDGILVDCHGRTSDASIFAAGEVTNYPIGRLGVHARTESWTTAGSQAVVAAATIAGEYRPFHELPWFWTDQYDANIQCLGLPVKASQFFDVGGLGEGSWLTIGLDDDGNLVGAEGFNAGRYISSLRRADRNWQPIPHELLKWSQPRESVGAAVDG
jgi:Uncharacterized NAD(FAD)-dependent dehydrogenases